MNPLGSGRSLTDFDPRVSSDTGGGLFTSVSAVCGLSFVTVSVSDRNRGIAPTVITRIFQISTLS